MQKSLLHFSFRTLLILTLTIFVALLAGCSEKDSSTSNNNETPEAPKLADTPSLTIMIPDSTALKTLTHHMITYGEKQVKGYKLSDIVTASKIAEYYNMDEDDTTGCRKMFNFEMVAVDSFSSRAAKMDLAWDKFKTGYYLPTEKQRIFFADESIVSKFRVKYCAKINLYRKISVVKPDGNKVDFEIGALGTTSVAYKNEANVKAIKLTKFLTKYVTEDASKYNYLVVSTDGYSQLATWDNVNNNGYFLPGKDYNRVAFITVTRELPTSVKRAVEIKLVTDSSK